MSVVGDINRVYRELEATISDGLDAEPAKEISDLRDKLIQELTQGNPSAH